MALLEEMDCKDVCDGYYADVGFLQHLSYGYYADSGPMRFHKYKAQKLAHLCIRLFIHYAECERGLRGAGGAIG